MAAAPIRQVRSEGSSPARRVQDRSASHQPLGDAEPMAATGEVPSYRVLQGDAGGGHGGEVRAG